MEFVHARTVPAALAAAFVLAAASAAAPGFARAGDPASAPAGASGDARAGRVIVLGFDGADARVANELMDAGVMPHLARLRSQGTFAPLWSTAPPESPVAWASLNSGQNPGETGVPSFFTRKLEETGGLVYPTFGHLLSEFDPSYVPGRPYARKSAPIERFDSGPLPLWSPRVVAACAGAAVLLGFLIVFRVLLRMRAAPSIALSLLLAAVGGWAGWTARRYLPTRAPHYGNPDAATPFWDHAARAGVKSVVLDAAQAFDQPSPEGAEVLWGLGVPDARLGLGDWFVYTDDASVLERPPEGKATGTSGRIFRIDERDGEFRSQLHGPANFWRFETLLGEVEDLERRARSAGFQQGQELRVEIDEREAELAGWPESFRVPVELAVRIEGERAAVRLGERTQTLAEGEWSQFYELEFPFNPLLSVHALTRVKLLSLRAPLRLFVNVLDVDPRAPPFWQPISTPHGCSGDLARASGLFETYGWACATMPFKDKEIDAVTFMEDVEFTETWRERTTMDAIARDDWRIFMSVFSAVDRVQHMMYQFYDREHPLHDAGAAAKTMSFFGETIALSEAIPAIYRHMDRVIGRVLTEHVRPGDTLIVCSDHGMQSFRRQVHVNNWLLENGYLALKPGLKLSKANAGVHDSYVDWSRTRAYSLSLGFLWINQKGRERHGIVAPEEAPALLDELSEKWLAATDPASGARVCTAVYRPAEIHSGEHVAREADLLLGFAPPYHVSFASGLGGLALAAGADGRFSPAAVYEDNRHNWSGDHTSLDLSAVLGVFACNRRVALPEGGADLLHVAPTVLSLVGVAPPAEMDLPPLHLED